MDLATFTTPSELSDYIQSYRSTSSAQPPLGGIGFVPTMGALHVGHRSLIDQARRENALVIVSIFVNPLQFGANEDLDRYPRQLEIDKALCEAAGVDILFLPTPESMGIGNTLTQVVPPSLMMSGLCGKTRLGHFQGVATIVTKLLNIIQPDRAYFGEKDAQQLAIIRRIVTDLNLPVDVVGCPTLRADSGLAHSSRNQYLSPTGKAQAAVIYRSLKRARVLVASGEIHVPMILAAVIVELASMPEFQLEYLEIVDPQTLQSIELIDGSVLIAIAGKVENTRLIDNITLPIIINS